MKTTVAVLRGGPSSEYEISLKSGATILQELNREKYEPHDIFISKTGQWHRQGVELPPEKALRGIEVALNVLHGEYGESGEVQRLLDTFDIAHTGGGPVQSALAFNKLKTKEALRNSKIRLARHLELARERDMNQSRLLEIFRTFPQPCIIKPVAAGSSVGVTLAKDYYSLAFGLDKAFEISPKIFIEEFIKGKEATCGVVEDFRGEELYSLLPIEIVPPPESPFFDYDAKYSGRTQEIVPGNFSAHEKAEIQKFAKLAHQALGLRHYSRSDFIVSPRGIYFLEVNSAPAIGFTSESLMPKALRAIGTSIRDFLDHVIQLTRKN